MYLSWNHESIRITGRWDRRKSNVVTTTCTGGTIEAAFYGPMVVLHFDVETNEYPYPHIWIQVDNGAMVESVLSHYIRVSADNRNDSMHHIKVIYKGAVEVQHRWYSPLVGKLSFRGMEVEKPGTLFDDKRRIMEFVGDSITEGVLIDAEYQPFSYGRNNRVYQDDVCATYGWLTAEKLNLRPRITGYGAVGVTKSGQASVPKAALSYPYIYDGCPLNESEPDFIVINHGANDRNKPVELYIAGYLELLKVIRKINPGSKIICLSAFCGVYPEELRKLVNTFNNEYNDSVAFIDSTGWITPEPLHPIREGHRIVAEILSKKLLPVINA